MFITTALPLANIHNVVPKWLVCISSNLNVNVYALWSHFCLESCFGELFLKTSKRTTHWTCASLSDYVTVWGNECERAFAAGLWIRQRWKSCSVAFCGFWQFFYAMSSLLKVNSELKAKVRVWELPGTAGCSVRALSSPFTLSTGFCD